jgi:hypothetical protein
MLRSLKLATPETAFFVVVPLRVPPLGFVAIATVIAAVDVVTVLPRLSWTVIVGCPPRALPAVALVGCVVKTTLLAAAAVMLNALLVALVSPVTEAVNV